MSTESLDAFDVDEAAFDDSSDAVISSYKDSWTGAVCVVDGGCSGSWMYCWQNTFW